MFRIGGLRLISEPDGGDDEDANLRRRGELLAANSAISSSFLRSPTAFCVGRELVDGLSDVSHDSNTWVSFGGERIVPLEATLMTSAVSSFNQSSQPSRSPPEPIDLVHGIVRGVEQSLSSATSAGSLAR